MRAGRLLVNRYRAHAGEQVGQHVALGKFVQRLLDRTAAQEILDETVFFLLRVIQPGDAFRGAQALVRGLLPFEELLRHRCVVLRTRYGRGEDERTELWWIDLAVPVDAAIALLNPDQAPRDVVVDKVMAFPVQVHAFGRDVGGQQ